MIMAPRHKAAIATWTEQLSKCFLMADIPDSFDKFEILVCSGITALLGCIIEIDRGVRKAASFGG